MLSHFVSFAFYFIVVKAAFPETHQLCRFVCPSSFGPAPLVEEVLFADGSAKQCVWFGNKLDARSASFDPNGNVISGSQFGSNVIIITHTDQYCAEVTDGWTWPDGQVCFRDSVSSRTLQGDTIIPLPNNSPEECTSACDAMGFTFAGVEFGSECHCGTGIASPIVAPLHTQCTFPCTGNTSESCGAADFIEIFQGPNPPRAAQLPPGWSI